jgi:hypothetical protein
MLDDFRWVASTPGGDSISGHDSSSITFTAASACTTDCADTTAALNAASFNDMTVAFTSGVTSMTPAKARAFPVPDTQDLTTPSPPIGKGIFSTATTAGYPLALRVKMAFNKSYDGARGPSISSWELGMHCVAVE